MNSNTCGDITPLLTRRDVLKNVACGFGWLAFAGLVGKNAIGAETSPLMPKLPHFTPRAKRVIFLSMRGGPSHVDTFDYKPKLTADTDKPGKRPGTKLLGSKWKFSQHGRSGQWISELFPNVAKHADEMCARALDADGSAGASAGVPEDAHGQLAVRPSVARRVDALRARHGKSRTCRASSRSRRRRVLAARKITAARFSPRSTRPRASARTTARSPTPRCATSRPRSARRRSARSWNSSRRSTARRSRRDRVQSGGRGRHRELRTRLQDAEPDARGDGPHQGNRGDEEALRHRQHRDGAGEAAFGEDGDGRHRPEVPARAAIHRVRRALRGSIATATGTSISTSAPRSQANCTLRGPAHRRPAHGSASSAAC